MATNTHASSPSGKDLIQIIQIYPNGIVGQYVIEELSKDELSSIQKEINEGKAFHLEEEGQQWISYIVIKLLKAM